MSPLCRVPGIRSLSRLTERRKVDLPHPDGPMIAVTAAARDVEVQLLEHLALAVREVEIAHRDGGAASCPRGRRAREGKAWAWARWS